MKTIQFGQSFNNFIALTLDIIGYCCKNLCDKETYQQ
jgi:hypothetical protein